MDPPSGDMAKISDMVMCGDHPSFTKTELNVKEAKPEEKDKLKEKLPLSYARISPTSSRTERVVSEHGLRAAARGRVRAPGDAPRLDSAVSAPANRALVQAALGSFRWPPYLLCVWVLVLVLTHLLHCLASLLERTLPSFKKLCHYFRTWTEESWKTDTDLNHRLYPIALATLTAALYSLYGAVYAVHAVTIWSIEPLCPDDRDRSSSTDIKVTNYVNEVISKTNSSVKH